MRKKNLFLSAMLLILAISLSVFSGMGVSAAEPAPTQLPKTAISPNPSMDSVEITAAATVDGWSTFNLGDAAAVLSRDGTENAGGGEGNALKLESSGKVMKATLYAQTVATNMNQGEPYGFDISIKAPAGVRVQAEGVFSFWQSSGEQAYPKITFVDRVFASEEWQTESLQKNFVYTNKNGAISFDTVDGVNLATANCPAPLVNFKIDFTITDTNQDEGGETPYTVHFDDAALFAQPYDRIFLVAGHHFGADEVELVQFGDSDDGTNKWKATGAAVTALSIDGTNNVGGSTGGALRVDSNAAGTFTRNASAVVPMLKPDLMYTLNMSTMASGYRYLKADMVITFSHDGGWPNKSIDFSGSTNAAEAGANKWITRTVKFYYRVADGVTTFYKPDGTTYFSQAGTIANINFMFTVNNNDANGLFIDNMGISYAPDNLEATTYSATARAMDADGELIEDVTYTVYREDGTTEYIPAPAMTTTNGITTIEGIAGTVKVRAAKEGVVFVNDMLTVGAGVTFDAVFVQKTDYVGTVTVKEGDTPVEDALVMAKKADGSEVSVTNAGNGVYTAELDQQAEFTVYKDNYNTEKVSLSFAVQSAEVALTPSDRQSSNDNYSFESGTTGWTAENIPSGGTKGTVERSANMAKNGVYSMNIKGGSAKYVPTFEGGLQNNVMYTFAYSASSNVPNSSSETRYYSYTQHDLIFTTDTGAQIKLLNGTIKEHSEVLNIWQENSWDFAIIPDGSELLIVDTFGAIKARGAGTSVQSVEFYIRVQNGMDMYLDDAQFYTTPANPKPAGYSVSVTSLDGNGDTIHGVAYTVCDTSGAELAAQPESVTVDGVTTFKNIEERITVKAEKDGVSFVSDVSGVFWYGETLSFNFVELVSYTGMVTVVDIYGNTLEGAAVSAVSLSNVTLGNFIEGTAGVFSYTTVQPIIAEISKEGYVTQTVNINASAQSATVKLYAELPQSAGNIISGLEVEKVNMADGSGRGSVNFMSHMSRLPIGKWMYFTMQVYSPIDGVTLTVNSTATMNYNLPNTTLAYPTVAIDSKSLVKGQWVTLTGKLMIIESNSDVFSISNGTTTVTHTRGASEDDNKWQNFNIFYNYTGGVAGQELKTRNTYLFEGYDANILVPEGVTGIEVLTFDGNVVDSEKIVLQEEGVYKITDMTVPIYVKCLGVDFIPVGLVSAANARSFEFIMPFDLTVTLLTTSGAPVKDAIISAYVGEIQIYMALTDADGKVVFTGVTGPMTLKAISGDYYIEVINFKADRTEINMYATLTDIEDIEPEMPVGPGGKCVSDIDDLAITFTSLIAMLAVCAVKKRMKRA